jgi:hypothetical protein
LTEKKRRQAQANAYLSAMYDIRRGAAAGWTLLFGGAAIVGLLVHGRYLVLLVAALALAATTAAVMAGTVIHEAGRRRLAEGRTRSGQALNAAYRAYIFAVLSVSGYLVFRHFSAEFPAHRDGDESAILVFLLGLVITSAPGILLAIRQRNPVFAAAAMGVMVLVNAVAFFAATGVLDAWGGLAMVYGLGFCVAFGVSLLPSSPLPAPPT